MPKRGWTEREGKRFVYETSMLCNIIALVLTLIAFCSPYWIVSWPRVFSQFKRIGLWEVCLAGMVLEMDPAQKSYHGCWWILAPEFKNITGWLMPPWFVWTQVIVTFCFVAQMCIVGLQVFVWFRTGMTQRDPKVKVRRDPYELINITCIATFVTGVVLGVTVVLFAVMFKTDRNWIPNPNLNYLSWSYGLAVLSAFFMSFASIGLFTDVAINRKEMRLPPKADPMLAITPIWCETDTDNELPSLLSKSNENISRSKNDLSKPPELINIENVSSSEA